MKKNGSALAILFSLVMLVFVLFMVWYLPSLRTLEFNLTDKQKSLETSLGRERKQQHEYDEAVAALPEVDAELNQVIPLRDAALEEVNSLKEQRKTLRAEKKTLTEKKEEAPAQNEEAGHE